MRSSICDVQASKRVPVAILPAVDRTETGELIEAALGGEPTARGALLERLRGRLVFWSRTRMSAALQAKLEPEDAAQEILLAVHRDMDRFEGRERRAFMGWLFTVAEHRLADLGKYYGAVKRQPVEPRSFSQTSPYEHAARRERLARIEEGLQHMNAEDCEAIRLRYIEERSYAEVGKKLGCSEGAARVRVCRALKVLRTYM